jgi:prevent-host-death family protein
MGMKDDIRSVTYMKSNAADLLEQINRDGRPVIITQNGEPRAVVLDPTSYERMRSAIGLLKVVAQGEQDIRAGRAQDHETLFDALTRKFSK